MTKLEFETHVTLQASENAKVAAARQWTIDHQLKWTEIELDRGDHPFQPMITFWGGNSLNTQLQAAANYQRQLALLGIDVVRVKTEIESSEAQVCEPGQYFECHIKLHLQSPDQLDRLAEIANHHGAHLSRNARRIRDDKTQERFVTLRNYDCSGRDARHRERRLADAIDRAALTVLEVESEFVVYDSNLSLDKGWEDTHV